ncbi:hypothetical protein JR316_0005834 [Psilocybe cubensis]|uniref:Uncharacterized protein n=1 Tax=Psilocybe cubensis TaxID=181762 RepID=A0ACB8H0V1_PSICU|nr:hypothetical protein JR316_0005834 [Psilocybe cubensis]KAH9481312.1 hypothetical protein JR316_0005834 [Psilocybe cubensis]
MDRSSTKETALEEIEGVLSEPRTQEQYTGAIWTTKRPELWAYYLYYVGNNGLSGFNFGPSQFQNLLFLAGYDPVAGPGSACSVNGCVLPYLGEIRDILLFKHFCYSSSEHGPIMELGGLFDYEKPFPL